jgi:hypothetical protein
MDVWEKSLDLQTSKLGSVQFFDQICPKELRILQGVPTAKFPKGAKFDAFTVLQRHIIYICLYSW